eukprot:GEMP01031023.1.p1 GENE.GEMP01031023.1~~GEMP01031023.1.p1  ORF type:complete len:454 (+),score=74.74 GEMP01031023.1:259-1620(+)
MPSQYCWCFKKLRKARRLTTSNDKGGMMIDSSVMEPTGSGYSTLSCDANAKDAPVGDSSSLSAKSITLRTLAPASPLAARAAHAAASPVSSCDDELSNDSASPKNPLALLRRLGGWSSTKSGCTSGGSPQHGKNSSASINSRHGEVKEKAQSDGATPSQQRTNGHILAPFTHNGILAIDATVPVKEPVFNLINGLQGNEGRFLAALQAIRRPGDWSEVSPLRKAKVRAQFKHTSGDRFAWVWMAIELDYPLVQSMSLGNELDLWPKWNKVVTSNELLEPATRYKVQNRWLRSLAHGLYKTDTLNCMQRFVNHDQNYYLEHITPLGPSESTYLPPTKGYYRESMESSLMLLPIAGGKTLWLSNTKAEFPISLHSWVAKQIIPTVAREIAMSVINGCALVGNPETGGPWMERIMRDSSGLYAEMSKLVEHPYGINNLPPDTAFPCPHNARKHDAE